MENDWYNRTPAAAASVPAATKPESRADTPLADHTPHIALLAAMLGAARPILFCRANALGINAVLFSVLWCVCIRAALRLTEQTRVCRLWPYFSGIITLSLTILWSVSDWVQLVSSAGILLLQLLLLLDAFSESLFRDYGRFIGGAWSLVWRAVGRIFEPFCALHALRKNSRGKGSARQVLIGLLIALPLAAAALCLLSGADAVFRTMLERILHSYDDFGETATTILMILFGFLGTALFFWCPLLAQSAKAERAEPKEHPLSPPLVAVTFLSVLALIYGVFCAIQISVLFSAHTSALPDGYSYAEYAREGFFQLLAVSIMNVVIVLLTHRLFRRSRAVLVLLVLLSACTLLMEVSAVQRMLLYVSVYGLTPSRLIVLWFLLVTAVVLALTVWSLFRPGFQVFRPMLWAVLVLWLAFAFARPDAVVARYNFDRFGATTETAELTVYSLSLDAVPVMTGYVPEASIRGQWNNYLDTDVPRSIRERSVRGFNLAVWEAERALEAYHGE